MKYLCMVWFEDNQVDIDGLASGVLSEEEGRALDRESLAYDEELRKRGYFIAANALQAPATARIVRVRNGKVSTIDGPFAETKEQLGGFILIEAKDMNDATRVAAKIPVARLGTIEVRPIMELTGDRVQEKSSAGRATKRAGMKHAQS